MPVQLPGYISCEFSLLELKIFLLLILFPGLHHCNICIPTNLFCLVGLKFWKYGYKMTRVESCYKSVEFESVESYS